MIPNPKENKPCPGVPRSAAPASGPAPGGESASRPADKQEDPLGGNEILPLRPTKPNIEKKGIQHYYCLGPSMNPSLRAGDLLTVAPYRNRAVRRGDVVILRPPGEDRLIAHRIILAGGDKLQARGDNNSRADPWILRPEDILGRVVLVERRGRPRALRGGPSGDLRGRVIRCLTMSRLALFRVFRPAYRWADRSGIFKRIVPLRFRPRVVAIQRPYGVELQLAAGRFVLGRRPAGSKQWLIKRPFKPFLDLARLP
jgi:hypothetical protein